MKYFTLEELTRSAKATELGIDNTPPPEVIANLEALVANVLDPLREIIGKPIRINSGYRSPELNRAVGGARRSQHLKGEAADFVIVGGTKADMYKAFAIIKNRLPFDQLIDEYDLRWIHVSYSHEGHNRKQVLRTK